MPSIQFQMQQELTTEQKVDLLFDYCAIFERDQSLLLRGMQMLLQKSAMEEEFARYISDRDEELRRIRAAAGMATLADEKTDPGRNG